MPHVNDARRLGECARLLGAPPHVEATARHGGCRPLDTSSPGQQEFQALLLWCLLSPYRSLAWDTKTGRGLRDMHCYYSWVSPHQDRLVTGWTVAARVASYLLPCEEDQEPGFSGIPGLRLAKVTGSAIELLHLVTGGRLELRDGTRQDRDLRAATLESEIHSSASTAQPAGRPLWLAPSLSAGEKAALDQRALSVHAPALSAVMARLHVLWHWDTGVELGTDPATGIPQLSWWGGPALDYITSVLTDPSSPLHVPGSRRWRHTNHTMFMGIGDAAVELRGPAAGANDLTGSSQHFRDARLPGRLSRHQHAG